MAVTRHATGNSRPRQFPIVEETTTTTTKKKTTKKPAVAGGRVGKSSTAKKPATTHRRKPTVGDKVKGAAKKLAGKVERKPGKKAAGTAEMRGHDGKTKHKV